MKIRLNIPPMGMGTPNTLRDVDPKFPDVGCKGGKIRLGGRSAKNHNREENVLT
jgi:hypothetical protein